MTGLTPQRDHFSSLVASGKTYAEAYRIAFPKSVKWKNEVVWVKSSELMADGNVQVRVKELRELTIKRNEVTLDEVLREMANWLKFNVKSIFNEDGSMKPLHEMTDEESSSIASYEVTELFGDSKDGKIHVGYLKKVRLMDKRAVADMFLRKLGAYIDTHKLVVEDLSFLDEIIKGIKG